jgi:hypothetical protein
LAVFLNANGPLPNESFDCAAAANLANRASLSVSYTVVPEPAVGLFAPLLLVGIRRRRAEHT